MRGTYRSGGRPSYERRHRYRHVDWYPFPNTFGHDAEVFEEARAALEPRDVLFTHLRLEVDIDTCDAKPSLLVPLDSGFDPRGQPFGRDPDLAQAERQACGK